MKKRTRILILCISMLVVGAVIFSVIHKKSPANVQQMFHVRSERRDHLVEISGNIEAANEQSFNAPADTSVERIFFKEGDSVKKGQIMMQLDNLEQEYNIQNLEYQLEQKKLTGARNDIALMEKQLAVLRKKMEDRQCIARFDGILAQVSVDEGEFVEIKDALGVLIDRSYLKSTVEVVETDASKLRVGQKVTFNFPAYTKEIEGYVDYVPSVGTITTRGATVIKAQVRIDNPPDEILTGYSFTGTIEIAPAETVLLIEKKAVQHRGEKMFVRVVDGVGGSEREIIAESYGDSYMLIHSGLSEGDSVFATVLPDSRAAEFNKAISPSMQGKPKTLRGAGSGPRSK